MKLFTKNFDGGGTYTAQDFLNEEAVAEAFSNESGTTLKLTAVYEEDGFVRMKAESFEHDIDNGYGDYGPSVSDFFGSIDGAIFRVVLSDQKILHKDYENQ